MKTSKNQPVAPKAISQSDIRFAVLATDIVCFRIIDSRLSVLLGKINSKGNLFDGQWALVGGLIRPKETADRAAERLLADKAGIKEVYKEQLYTFSRVDRDTRGRVVSVAFIALASHNPQSLDAAQLETRWVPISELPKLAYDHDEIMSVALERLRAKIRYTTLLQHALPKEFTLSEFQRAYEVVLGEGLDKRNFRKKILAANILKDTGTTKKEGVMRPAALYSFVSRKVQVMEIV